MSHEMTNVTCSKYTIDPLSLLPKLILEQTKQLKQKHKTKTTESVSLH